MFITITTLFGSYHGNGSPAVCACRGGGGCNGRVCDTVELDSVLHLWVRAELGNGCRSIRHVTERDKRRNNDVGGRRHLEVDLLGDKRC
jgi:hypothetical protein